MYQMILDIQFLFIYLIIFFKVIDLVHKHILIVIV